MTDRVDIKALDELLHRCLKCGLCLPVCPTYDLTYDEQSSPRGRIRLMKYVHEGSIDVTRNFADEMYFCLDCQACQTACPAGVQYGALVEDARALIDKKKMDPFALWMLKSVFLQGILVSKRRTKLAARLLRLYQRIGLREAIDRTGLLGLFSDSLRQKHLLLPVIDAEFFDETTPEVVAPQGEKRGRVVFLSGCIMNVAFVDVHRDAVAVLSKNGFEVVIPRLQQCCGSLHGHNGDLETARTLARQNLDVLDELQYDALVVDSAGCGAFLKEYGKLLSDDAEYASRAESLAKKVKDVTEFLPDVGFIRPEPPGWNHSNDLVRVTYHEACHLVHTQKISQQPRELLLSIPGIEFVELPEATWCCGSAGIYNVVRFEDSMEILDRKMKNLASTHADIVVTANPGCHIQLQYGIKKFGLNMEVLHPVSLLNRAYVGWPGRKEAVR